MTTAAGDHQTNYSTSNLDHHSISVPDQQQHGHLRHRNHNKQHSTKFQTADDHFVDYPSHWEHQSALNKQPLGSAFHSTRVVHVDPNTNKHYHWESRANRKHRNADTTFGGDIASNRKWWTFVWCWRPSKFAWWNAFSFSIGSAIFVIEATVFLFPDLSGNDEIALDMGIFALVGAILFVVGGTSQVLEVLQAPVSVDWAKCAVSSSRTDELQAKIAKVTKDADDDRHIPVHGGHRDAVDSTATPDMPQDRHALHNVQDEQNLASKQRSKQLESETNPQHRTGFDVMFDSNEKWSTRLYTVFGQWRRIDYTLAVIQFVGTLLFVVNSVGQAGWYEQGEGPGIDNLFFYGVSIGPDIAASCTFVISGYLQVIEATHRITPDIELTNIGWHAGWNNTMGGFGFLANAIVYMFVPFCGSCDQFVMNTIPLLIGSWFFLFGSLVAWYEQCTAAWEENVKRPALEAELRGEVHKLEDKVHDIEYHHHHRHQLHQHQGMHKHAPLDANQINIASATPSKSPSREGSSSAIV